MKTRTLFFIFFLAIIVQVSAQIRIKGKVLDEKDTPLEGASVYLNNTTKGTTTDNLGEFELLINEGVYDLIVSYIGYQTLQYQIDTKKPNKPFVFKTIPMTNMLDEIVLNKRKYSAEDRAYFLSRFKQNFLGKTELSKECTITNLDAIQFNFNHSTRILEAFANEPIEIINKGLGYKISYNLVHFELTPTKIVYQGYSKYEDLKGSKRKKRKWNKNRLVAYKGSKMHFIRSVLKGVFYEEGFIVDEYQRIPNPDRPSDSIIQETRKYLNTFSSSVGAFKITSNMSINIKDDRTKEVDRIKRKKRDSALAIIRQSRYEKFVDKKLRENLTEKDFIIRTKNLVTMKYDHLLYVKYMNEKEEYNFRPGPNRLDYQLTKLILLSKSVILDKAGVFIDPLDVFTEGYWGYEKTANALPLDFTPKE
tara:strand:+ start:19084 stop:20343 length:1260 start_codon:yes stop_codon:yes gene_type:complete